MIRKIANKAGQEMTVRDQDNIYRKIKLLNTAYLGIRKLHTDQQGVATPDSGIVHGSMLRFEGGESMIVSTLTNDYHRGEIIRFAMDLVECNHTVTIVRPTLIKTPQGGIAGHNDVLIYRDAPVKIGTIFQRIDTDNDATVSQFGMLLSTLCPVKQGDTLIFNNHYENAKVEGIKLNYEGIYEIAFDKDPRWS